MAMSTSTLRQKFRAAYHDDEQPVPFWQRLLEQLRVGHSLLSGMDRARSDDYDEAIVLAADDAGGGVARAGDDLARVQHRKHCMPRVRTSWACWVETTSCFKSAGWTSGSYWRVRKG